MRFQARRTAARVAMLLCLVPASAGAAAVGPATVGIELTSEVVLRGSRSASVDVRLSRPVTLGPADLFDPPKAAFESSRVGAGYALINMDHAFYPPTLVGVRAPEGSRSRAIQLPFGDDRRGNDVLVTLTLPAGRYRLYLLTDGPATVRFRLPGATRGTRSLAPVRFEQVAMRRSDAAPSERPVGDVAGNAQTLGAEQTLVVQTVAARLVPSVTGYESWSCLYDGAPPAGYLPRCLGAAQGSGVGIRLPMTDFDYSGLSAFVNLDGGSRAVSRSLEAHGRIRDLSFSVLWIPMPLGKPQAAVDRHPVPVALDNVTGAAAGAGSAGRRTSSGS